MSMGNYMIVRGERTNAMATKQPPVGMAHPTVRPTNFDPEAEPADTDADSEQ
jgi:hypothetical protein